MKWYRSKIFATLRAKQKMNSITSSSEKIECDHKTVVTTTTGAIYMSAGEVIDTLHDITVCTTCGQEINDDEERKI